jgi:hypothetical protein
MFKLLLVVGVLAARSADAQTDAIYDRNPATASVLGALLPGAGHIYAGEPLRGAGFFLVSAGFIAEGFYSRNNTDCPVFSGFCDQQARTRDLRRLSVFPIALGVIAWIGGAIDAPRAVRRERARKKERQPTRTSLAAWRPFFAPGNTTLAGVRATW